MKFKNIKKKMIKLFIKIIKHRFLYFNLYIKYKKYNKNIKKY